MVNKIGIVTHSKGNWYTVLEHDTQTAIECRLKGKLRLTEWNTTNPIAVGDVVHFTIENDGKGLIFNIEERKNGIMRKAAGRNPQAHIIAANIDQLVILATLAQPRTSLGFIDRMLVIAEAYKIPQSTILWNKCDFYDTDMRLQAEYYAQMYQNIGYSTDIISALDKTFLPIVTEIIQHKTSVLIGHSGTGKSTLLNLLNPNLSVKTGDISLWSSKGKHTTTLATMHLLPLYHAQIIDTPGIKELDFFNIEPEEVSRYYPDFLPYLSECKFNNCLHQNEPHCAIKKAVQENKIYPERYQNYLGILEMLQCKI
jgi:ribosome biogenesis GTPase